LFPSDIDLVEKLQKGDVEAFDLIYEKYSGKLYTFGLKYLRSASEAEELVQSVFLKLWEKHKDLKIELSFNSYLFAIGYAGYSLETFHQNNWCQKRITTRNWFYSQVPPLEQEGSTARWDPYHTLWPIPDQVITANTGAVINQNEGYTGSEKNVPPSETIE
jgi:hypothetical protein